MSIDPAKGQIKFAILLNIRRKNIVLADNNWAD